MQTAIDAMAIDAAEKKAMKKAAKAKGDAFGEWLYYASHNTTSQQMSVDTIEHLLASASCNTTPQQSAYSSRNEAKLQ